MLLRMYTKIFLYKHQIYPKNIKNQVYVNYLLLWADTPSVLVFLWYTSENWNILSNLAILDSIWTKNYYLGNSFTNDDNFELKVGQYLRYHGIHHEIRTYLKFGYFYRIWAKEGPDMGKIWGKIYFFSISSPIIVILRWWNSARMCISIEYIRKIGD